MTPAAQFPESPDDLLKSSRAALVVWDMQIGMAGKALGVEALKQTVAALIAAADAAEIPVIWSRHVGLPLEFTTLGRRHQLMQRQGVASPDQVKPHMLPGDADVAFLPGLQPAPHHLVLDKTTPSFFIGTPFDSSLRAAGAQVVVLCGVATERGIEFTARHAMALGYFVVVVEDGVGSFTSEGHAIGMAYMRSAMPVIPASRIVSIWRASAGQDAGRPRPRPSL